MIMMDRYTRFGKMEEGRASRGCGAERRVQSIEQMHARGVTR